MSSQYLLERTIDVHHRLLDAGIDNAIGGALCLGYHIDDPRGTRDIDINVSAPSSMARTVLSQLPPDVPWDEATVRAVERDDQVRIHWPVGRSVPLPLDLFFMADPLHETVRTRTVEVPMLDATVRILSATDLAIFKALFNRPKDWVDIQSMLDAHDASVDLDEVIAWVVRIVGEGDARVTQLRSLQSA